MSKASTFAATFVAFFAAHQIGDHWVQTSHQAGHKHLRNNTGRLACARHVATYTATTSATVATARKLLGLPISRTGFVAGQAISAATHYWADRRFTLAAAAKATGHAQFYKLGAPREGRDDNPSLGTGAYAMDQSWHVGWLFVSSLATALIGAK